MNKPYFFANWKMNVTLSDAVQYFEKRDFSTSSVCFFVPTIYLHPLQNSFPTLSFGAQNFYQALNGSVTGEISLQMLQSLSIRTVLIGHSERRLILQETDTLIDQKLADAFTKGFQVVYCVRGLEDLRPILHHAPSDCILAFEPTSAIGTGKPYPIEQITQMIDQIKSKMDRPVLYGGSVNFSNAATILEKTHADGFLIGKASLDPGEFYQIIQSCTNAASV